MNWKEPKVIEWSSRSGLTKFDPLNGTITVYVPKGDTRQSRFVRRHEMLHVKYDKPELTLGLLFSPSIRAYMQGEVSSYAHHTVSDVFVHLIYWPKEYSMDSVESREAAEFALERLRYLALIREPDGMEILRAMAILSAVGTEDERAEGGRIIYSLAGKTKFLQYVEVLKLVRENKRPEAEKLMELLTPLYHKNRSIENEVRREVLTAA